MTNPDPVKALKKLVDMTKEVTDIDFEGMKEKMDRWTEVNEEASRAVTEKAKPARFP